MENEDSQQSDRARERVHEDVASPVELQELWDQRGELPGFAIGT